MRIFATEQETLSQTIKNSKQAYVFFRELINQNSRICNVITNKLCFVVQVA